MRPAPLAQWQSSGLSIYWSGLLILRACVIPRRTRYRLSAFCLSRIGARSRGATCGTDRRRLVGWTEGLQPSARMRLIVARSHVDPLSLCRPARPANAHLAQAQGIHVRARDD